MLINLHKEVKIILQFKVEQSYSQMTLEKKARLKQKKAKTSKPAAIPEDDFIDMDAIGGCLDDALKEATHTNKKAGSSLWDNPMVEKARKEMSEEQLAQFQRIGEAMYGFDFEQGDIDSMMKDSAEYISLGLKSGMNPGDLDEDEKTIMEEIHGPTWFLKFDLTEEEAYPEDY